MFGKLKSKLLAIFAQQKVHKEKGLSLLEFMISMVIFMIAAQGIFSAMENVNTLTQLTEAAPALYQRDQVVRYEISWVLDDLQRSLITTSTEDVCTQPWKTLMGSQAEFKYQPSMVIGDPLSFRESGKVFGKSYEYAQSVIDQFETVQKQALAARVHPSVSQLEKALARCQRANLSITATTQDIKNKSSLYLCAYGPRQLVEIKAVFWDFLNGTALKCSQQNAKPGRGLQILYKVYQLEDYAGKGQKGYLVRSYVGRMFVPKKVREEQNQEL